MNAAERKERARIAAAVRWSQPGARARQAAAAKAAMIRRLERLVDPDQTMTVEERAHAVAAAARGQAARLRLARRKAS